MNCLKRKRDTTPQWRFSYIFFVVIRFGTMLYLPAASLAKTPYRFGGILKIPVSSIRKCGPVSSENNLKVDTSIKDTSSYFEKYQRLINSGRVPFFGTWSDYFSSYLKINRDSSFHFSWGFNGKSCWPATGKWIRSGH